MMASLASTCIESCVNFVVSLKLAFVYNGALRRVRTWSELGRHMLLVLLSPFFDFFFFRLAATCAVAPVGPNHPRALASLPSRVD